MISFMKHFLEIFKIFLYYNTILEIFFLSYILVTFLISNALINHFYLLEILENLFNNFAVSFIFNYEFESLCVL